MLSIETIYNNCLIYNVKRKKSVPSRLSLLSFEEFVTDDEKVALNERTKYVIGVGIRGIICGFTMETLKEDINGSIKNKK